MLDIDSITQEFPLLANQCSEKRPLVYLDNAATTHKPECVLQTQDYYYRHDNANPARGAYALGKRSTQIYENSRAVVAEFIGCDKDEVVFTSGTTDSLNMIAYAWGIKNLKPGDEVVLPISEHHSSLVPWQTVAELTGARLTYVLCDDDGCFAKEAWEKAIGQKTKVVAVAHVSNVLGNVVPLELISQMAHEVGAIVVADLAQSIGHLPVHVKELGVDFAAFSGHKMYAPMGIGVLYGRRELLDKMDPLRRGGGMIKDVFEKRSSFAEAPARFEAGTPNVAGAIGLARAIGFLQEVGFDAIVKHEKALTRKMLDGLRAIPDVRLWGSSDGDAADLWSRRIGVVSFSIAGVDSLDVGIALERSRIAVRAGAHCAEPLVRFLGEKATLRASLGVYTTEEEIERFLEAMKVAKKTVVFLISTIMK